MKRYNISVPKEGKDGKTYWSNVGTMVWFPAAGTKDDGFIFELNMFPNTKFGVFEQKLKAERKELTDDEKFARDQKAKLTSPDPLTGEEIDPESIPF